MIGFSRSGSTLFWKAAPDGTDPVTCPARSRAEFAAPIALLVLLAVLSVAAGWVSAQTQATARQVMAADRFITAVLGEPR